MVLNVSEIPPKVTGIVTLSGGRRGGPRKNTVSLFKDVTIRLGRAGVKGKRDNVALYEVFSTVWQIIYKRLKLRIFWKSELSWLSEIVKKFHS